MRLVVLISGNGSNLQAIIDAIQTGSLPARIEAVISNKRDAFGLHRAQNADIASRYFPLKPYREQDKSREEYDMDLAALISEYQPDWIVLAGWMHILSAAFLNQFPERVINLHPALPGQIPGTHAIERAFEAFQNGEIRHSGVMIHHVIPEIDAGEVILAEKVPIYAEDTLETFAERMHITEHYVIVKALQILAGC